MNKDTMINVINKYNGTVGYDVPDLGVHRNFYPGEHKEVTFDELEKLSFAPGGNVILSEYLEIADKDALEAIFGKQPEPEYHYSRDDIKELMLTGSLDQFLDCLDFAPESVKEIIKDMAVDLPLNDVAKRDAIQEKLGFNVSAAIEIKNTKYDGATDEEGNNENRAATGVRRAAPVKKDGEVATATGRRYQPTTNK